MKTVLYNLTKSSPIRIIDIGASGGIHERWKNLGVNFEAILFEPDSRVFNELKESMPKNYTVLSDVLSNEDSMLDFNLCQKQTCSSVYKSNMKRLKLFPESERFQVADRIRISASRLDAALERHDISGIDFMKIDAEASELRILKGASNTVKNLLGVEIEVSFFPIRKDQPLFHKIHEQMLNYGFELYDLRCDYWKRNVPISHRTCTKGQLIWGDGLYMISPEKILELPDVEERIKKAFAMYLVYGYYDLVSVLSNHAHSKGIIDCVTLGLVNKFLNSETKRMPSFRGLGVIQRLLKRLTGVFSSPGWASNSSDQLGNCP